MRSFKPGRKPSSFKGRRYNHGKKRFREAEPVEPRPTRINKDALRLLAQIGTPERTPFVPDPFQIESLEKVLTEDVLVSAPTGSGKTWIALEATKEYLARGCGIWYATPLKALSNAKYEEFGQIFGPERVGILTGDRKENADAPVIVGTTEILRNQLYDSMQAGIDLDLDLVILGRSSLSWRSGQGGSVGGSLDLLTGPSASSSLVGYNFECDDCCRVAHSY